MNIKFWKCSFICWWLSNLFSFKLLVLDCLDDIRGWTALNFHNFYRKKTEVILFKSCGSSCIPTFDFSSLAPHKKKSSITNLSIKLESHVNTVVKSPIFQMRWLSKFKSILSTSHLETLIHASCLDYFNCLLIGISQASLSQLVQNGAALI